MRMKVTSEPTKVEISDVPVKASLMYFINVSVKNELQTYSEIGWVNKNQFILTINNEYYLVNLNLGKL